MLFCCLLCVVYCLLFVKCCLLFVVVESEMSFAVSVCVACCSLCDVRCVLFVVYCAVVHICCLAIAV